jgi:DNA-binding NarL/FixJ family response regulator
MPPIQFGQPTTDVDREIERGRASLRSREWASARDAFAGALAADPDQPRAWEGLAAAVLSLEDGEGCRSAWEQAYRRYLDRQDRRGAARMATSLGLFHLTYRGQEAVGSGWFERARTLLEGVPVSAEHAWLALWKAHVDIHVRGEVARGEKNLETAIRFGEACEIGGELELLANGLQGLMQVSEGAVADGLRRLDAAASAVVSGEMTGVDAIGWTFCYVLDASESVRDVERAGQRLERAMAAEHEIGIPHRAGFCRSHLVGALTWRGDYAAAEREIATMRSEVSRIAPAFVAVCDIRLGEVRRRQGRIDEAAALLEPHAARLTAMLSLAALALDRGKAHQAREIAERYLRRVSPTDRVRRMHGLEILAAAHVARGDLTRARLVVSELDATGGESATALMRAVARESAARVCAAAGELDAARQLFEDVVDAYELGVTPYEAAGARLELGDVLRSMQRRDSARTNYDLARTGAAGIGAQALEERAATAVTALYAGDALRNPSGLTPREIEILGLVARGVNNDDIGERLSISGFTVKRHIANILTKLDLPAKAAATACASAGE